MTPSTFLRCAFALSVLPFSGPPAYANTEWSGWSCGFVSTSDPSGVVNNDPNVNTGQMDCGPWTAYDLLADDLSGPSPTPSAAHIALCGYIQVNNATPGGCANGAASVTGEGDGVAFAVGVITYTAGPTDNVYLCTEITMTDDDSTEVYIFDEDDNAANGNQCGLAISAEGGGHFVNGRRESGSCVTVEHGGVGEEYCV